MASSQPVSSVVTGLIVGAVCGVILSTTGQTVQAEQQVLSRIDEAGTRSVTITDTNGAAGIRPDAVSRISRISGVEWVIGLGPAQDVRAAGIPAGNPDRGAGPLRAPTGCDHLRPVGPKPGHCAGRTRRPTNPRTASPGRGRNHQRRRRSSRCGWVHRQRSAGVPQPISPHRCGPRSTPIRWSVLSTSSPPPPKVSSRPPRRRC